MAHAEEQQDWEIRVETCRVELWRGYVTSSFVARVVDGPELGAVLDTSSSFRWRGSRTPDTEEARLAHHELVSRLKAGGWSPSGDGTQWYETELARPTLVPPAEAEPEAAEDEPPPVAVTAAPPVEPEPEAPPPARPAPEPVAPQPPRAHNDRWRGVARIGLLIAIAFLVVVAIRYR